MFLIILLNGGTEDTVHCNGGSIASPKYSTSLGSENYEDVIIYELFSNG